VKAWVINGTAPTVGTVSAPMHFGCSDYTFWSYDAMSQELWAIAIDHPITTVTSSTSSSTLTPTTTTTSTPTSGESSSGITFTVIVSVSSIGGVLLATVLVWWFRRSDKLEKQRLSNERNVMLAIASNFVPTDPGSPSITTNLIADFTFGRDDMSQVSPKALRSTDELRYT